MVHRTTMKANYRRSEPFERNLWHGTSPDSIISINTHGFNRSYCGKNGRLKDNSFEISEKLSISKNHRQSVKVIYANMFREIIIPNDRDLPTHYRSHQLFNYLIVSVRIYVLAVAYGQGAYFARDASYSEKYSTHNNDGPYQLYYAKVLTGEYVQGDSSMRTPPSQERY